MKTVIIIIFLLFSALYIAYFTSGTHPVHAQTCPVQSLNPRVKEGLISTLYISPNFGNLTGTCVISNQAQFLSDSIPTYDSLKSEFYDQAKNTDPTFTKHPQIDPPISIDDIDLRGTTDHLYFVNGNLLKGPGEDFPQDPNLKAGVVFVKGDFTIQSDIGYVGGLVFVVKGNIIINPAVTQINAVLISSGTIYTAGANCSSSSPVSASQLVVNGSLISLNANPIQFCRTLTDNACNNCAAEQIIQQPKYLVILRNIFSETSQKWSEIQ